MTKSLWTDCDGGIMTTELLLISSVVVAGLLTGLSSFRTNIENEFEGLSNKIQQSTQDFAVAPVTKAEPSIKTEFSGTEEFYVEDLADFID